MIRLQPFFYVVMVLLTVLSACAPQETPTQVPPTPPATEIPTLVPAPTDIPATETLVPVKLAGPEMKVGSTYPYVDGTLLVAVPAGPFLMGHGGSDNPEHTVTLSDFWIYSTKVTNQEYAFCVNSGQCTSPDLKDNITYTDFTRLNDPVSGVTYDQSAAYCSFVHGRLPTEAEWEKTARGPNGNIYPWGNNAPICDLLNFNNCVGKTTSVIKYPQGASFYSALDMEGNTFEWVADWYDPLYYKTGTTDNPIGPDKGTARSVRSTGYKAGVDQVPASTRFFSNPNDHRRDLGFRCVVDDPTWFAPFCTLLSFVGTGPGGGSGGNGTITYTCPKVSITSQGDCQGQSAVAQVNIHDNGVPDDPSSSVTVPAGCTPDIGDPVNKPHVFDQGYLCTQPGTASIKSVCSFTYSGGAQCAPHYNYNSGTGVCEWDGTGTLGTQCLPGFTYDPASQCCSAAPGSANNFPAVCDAGFTLELDSQTNQFICLPNNVAPPPPSASVQVLMPVCTKPGGGGCPTTDPNYPSCTPSGGNCPNGGTYSCTPDPRCGQFPTGCPYGPVCGCH